MVRAARASVVGAPVTLRPTPSGVGRRLPRRPGGRAPGWAAKRPRAGPGAFRATPSRRFSGCPAPAGRRRTTAGARCHMVACDLAVVIGPEADLPATPRGV